MASNYQGRTDLPVGIRNNNPGNIAIGDNWMGMVGNDGRFVIFTDMSWGIRAMAKSLKNMIGRGLDTIDTLIRQWSATDQDAYVTNVSQRTGIPADTQLGTDDDTIASLMRAIIVQENGADYSSLVTDQDIADGMALANGGVSTLAQAAVVQAQSDPVGTGIIAVGAILLLFALFGED